MQPTEKVTNRRNFIKSSGLLGAGLFVPSINLATSAPLAEEENIHQFGKREGYTDQISILVSMMDWMRSVVLK